MRNDSIYNEAGKTLGMIQLADSLFKSVLQICFPGEKFNNKEVWDSNEAALNKATLGKMIKILKERVEITEVFNENLNEYLRMRNDFIHNWDKIDNWGNDEFAIKFMVELQKYAAWVFYVMVAVINMWSEQTGHKYTTRQKLPPELVAIFSELTDRWSPTINSLITKVKCDQNSA